MRNRALNESAYLLRFLIREISEASYAAGWMKDLEYDLWACDAPDEWEAFVPLEGWRRIYARRTRAS